MAVDNLKSEILTGVKLINTTEETSGGVAKLMGNVANYAEAQTVKLIAASYTDGRLTGEDSVQCDSDENSVSEAFELNVNEGDTVKTFIWEDEMKPIN